MAKEQYDRTFENQLPKDAISFDMAAFDSMLGSWGVRLVHYAAMKCPIGLSLNDQYDSRRQTAHPKHSGCSNGYIYTKIGTVMGIFTGQGTHTKELAVGTTTGATVQVTLNRFYCDEGCEERPTNITNFDRFFVEEESVLVPMWGTFEAHVTGQERLNFPATAVERIMDSNGELYGPDDVTIVDGEVVWGQKRRPAPGTVCSIRYLMRPHWYVMDVHHEIRLARTTDEWTGCTSISRAPQNFTLQREYIYLNEEAGSGTDRAARGPADGSFGPR